jgi:hypothetical protein
MTGHSKEPRSAATNPGSDDNNTSQGFTPSEPQDDMIYLHNGISFVGLIGDPDYAETELDSCIDDFGQSLEQEEGASEVEPLRGQGNAGSEEGVAWATFAYVYTE